MTDEEQAAQEAEALALAELASGFTGEPLSEEMQQKVAAEKPETVETPETPEPVAEETDVPEAKTDEPTTETPQPETPAPKADGLSPDEITKLKTLLDQATSIGDIRNAVEKVRGDVFSRVGGLERELKKVFETASSGGDFEIKDEDLSEVAKEYPDLTKNLVAGLNRAAKRMPKGTPAPAVDMDEIERRAKAVADQTVAQERERIRLEVALQILDAQHEGWRETVGAENSDTPFRRWAKTQPDANTIFTTKDPVVFSKALTKFKASTKPKAPETPKEPDRGKRLAEAVTPKGAKRPPAPKALTPEEEFAAGFAEGPGAKAVAG